jgi:hypothetical protein
MVAEKNTNLPLMALSALERPPKFELTKVPS